MLCLYISVSVAAILLLSLDEIMSPDHVISKLRQVRGQRAFQTIKVRFVSQTPYICETGRNLSYVDVNLKLFLWKTKPISLRIRFTFFFF